METRIVVIGQSNARALRDGYERLVRDRPERPGAAEVTVIMKRPQDLAVNSWGPDGYQRRIAPQTMSEVLTQIGPTHVVLMWGGNQVNLRALLATGPPFDVILPPALGEADYAPDSVLVPCAAVVAYVRNRFDGNAELSDVLATTRSLQAKCLFLGPPPPLPGTAVRERLRDEAHFVGVMKKLGVDAATAHLVPDAVRQKLWVLLISTYQAFAAEQGSTFLPPPAGSTDALGMLDQRFWGVDATHASAEYGMRYMDEVLSWAGGCAP